MAFDRHQKTFMVESYFRNGRKVDGLWSYSIQECYQEFSAEFPELALQYDKFRKALDHSVKLFRETGSVNRKEGSGRPKKRTHEEIENVREIIENAPTTSIRHLAQQTELSVGTCHTILKKDLHFFPYRMTSVHELLPIDPPRRLQYCEWFSNVLNDELLDITFYSDEAWFHLTGYVNSQNMRMWSAENPHIYTETSLHPQKIGVWVAMSRRRLIGPIFFEGNILRRLKCINFDSIGSLL